MDRQDIDALLIGALYGELTPADEARLSAHLDSHPTDRGALDDLKSARQAVRESRIFELQLDPPQAVSALLLQEAHRRAPKRVVVSEEEEKESWFYRFTRMFMAHPAMAAAAMLVLVVGVASMLYVKKGEDTYSAPEVAAPALNENTSADPAAGPQAPAPVVSNTAPTEQPADDIDQGGAATSAEGGADQYRVGLEDQQRGKGTRDRAADLKAQQNKLETADSLRRDEAKKMKPSGSIAVTTPQPQPKDLPAKTGAKSDSSALDFESSTVVGGTTGTGTFSAAPSAGAGGGGAASGRAAPGGAPAPATPPRNVTSQPPPPPASATPPAQKPSTTASTSKQTVAKEAEKKPEPKPADAAPAKDSKDIAWAKGEHNRTRSLVSKGDCTTAAKVAVGIANRAPDYFSQYVSTDIQLKKCQGYIAAERDAEAERSGKARSQKRVNADEPAAESTK